ncbi:hypothetical protein LJC31_01720 [Synergistaceae bacterium OttesenSCG-928-I11]|nr:hypothetical protein [Synergistaceae bacterium OttesenSCG-928-I11]
MKTIVRIKIKRFCALAVAIFCLALGIDVSHAGPQIYKSNVLTASHVVVPGTHVAVVPPSGAVQAVNFRGFEIESRNIIYEIFEQGAPYSAVESTLTAEHLREDGIEVLDVTKVVLNERPATLVTGRKKPELPSGAAGEAEDLGVLLFVFGGEKLTVSIYGYHPVSDRSAANLLKTSMLSAIFEPAQKENAGGAYTLSTAGTSFQFVGEVNYTRQYRLSDSAPQGEDTGQPAIYGATMLHRNVPQTERAKFAEDTFASYMSSYEFTVSGNRGVSYGGLSGIELTSDFEGETRRSRTASGGVVRRPIPGKGYQVVLFDNSGRVFAFQGIALRDAEVYLAQFRKITATFNLTK